MRSPVTEEERLQMTAFRALLIILWLIIASYTVVTIVTFGPTLFPEFFGPIFAMTWQGQFNVDFSSFLILSAVWLAWRHHFTPAGLGLGVLGFFLAGRFF
jgi:hypothetical protein